jgi:hypothetical protein
VRKRRKNTTNIISIIEDIRQIVVSVHPLVSVAASAKVANETTRKKKVMRHPPSWTRLNSHASKKNNS